MLFVSHPKILHKHCLQFLSGVKMAPKETENNAYAKFWGDKQRALWYVLVFSGVVNSITVPLTDIYASTKNFAFLRYERGCKNKKKIADYKICKFFANASYVRPPSKDALRPFSIAMNTALAIV